MRFVYVVCIVTAAAILDAGRAEPNARYRRNFTPLDFASHVMLNESPWTLVLRENLRNLPPSPYADRFGESLVPVDGGFVEGRPIVVRALTEYSDIGSFVRYAANTLHRCLLCFVVRHLSFQTLYVVRLFAKFADPGVVLQELRSLKDNIVVSLDKLTVVHSAMDLVINLKWEVARLIQYDVTHRMRHAEYPVNAHQKLEEMQSMLLAYLTDNCAPFFMTRKFFQDLGIRLNNPLITDSVLLFVVDQDLLMELGKSHAAFLGRYLRSLDYETMPRSIWSGIFYESNRVPTADAVDETNVRISPLITLETAEPVSQQTSGTAEPSGQQTAEPSGQQTAEPSGQQTPETAKSDTQKAETAESDPPKAESTTK